MGRQARLLELCEIFFRDNRIMCGEGIYQDDQLSEKALDLVYGICSIVGYADENNNIKLPDPPIPLPTILGELAPTDSGKGE